MTLPQVRSMYAGDRARKQSLVDYGFRLPSAYDNRPLNFDEFYAHVNQAVFVSATPGDLELEKSAAVVEQVIRPTGLLDPRITVKPTDGQIDDLISEINVRTARGERILVTTLTKKMAEDLTGFLENYSIRVRYMHHDIDTVERMEIIRDLRLGEFDVLVGINLLREGLDIPRCRSSQFWTQIKRASCAADAASSRPLAVLREMHMARSLCMPTLSRRRWNTRYARRSAAAPFRKNTTKNTASCPQTIVKKVSEILEISTKAEEAGGKSKKKKKYTAAEKRVMIDKLTKEMKAAAKLLEFEHAAYLRDRIKELEK